MNSKEKSRTLSAFNSYRTRLRWANSRLEIWQDGCDWYAKGTQRLKRATDGVNISLYRAAGVASLLSPLTPWKRNLRGAELMIEMFGQRAPYEQISEVARRSTVYNNNAEKAVKYLHGNDLARPTGMKTEPFHRNLAGDLSAVTVDSWMWRIVNRFGLSSSTPTGNASRAIKRAVRMCGTLYGIAPAQAQAIIWTVERDYWNDETANRA